jgi:hypothetical protein
MWTLWLKSLREQDQKAKMKPETTTDLKKLKTARAILQEPAPVFALGEIVTMHRIGPYDIAEFHPWKKKGAKAQVGTADADAIEFYGWVDGRDVSKTWKTLDEAITGCIASRRAATTDMVGS